MKYYAFEVLPIKGKPTNESDPFIASASTESKNRWDIFRNRVSGPLTTFRLIAATLASTWPAARPEA